MNNDNYMPDIDSILSGIPKDKQTQRPDESQKKDNAEKKSGLKLECSDEGKLWNEFIECLTDDTDEKSHHGCKTYRIDDDIIHTLHQCDFGRSNAVVINAILRVFLIDNICNLKKVVKPRIESILDKYNNQD